MAPSTSRRPLLTDAVATASADLTPDLVAPWRTPSRTHVSTSSALGVEPVGFVPALAPGDATIAVRTVKDLSVVATWRMVEDVPLVHRLQAVGDLHDLGGADRLEAAAMVRLARLPPFRLPAYRPAGSADGAAPPISSSIASQKRAAAPGGASTSTMGRPGRRRQAAASRPSRRLAAPGRPRIRSASTDSRSDDTTSRIQSKLTEMFGVSCVWQVNKKSGSARRPRSRTPQRRRRGTTAASGDPVASSEQRSRCDGRRP